jgi:hypothetical protein
VTKPSAVSASMSMTMSTMNKIIADLKALVSNLEYQREVAAQSADYYIKRANHVQEINSQLQEELVRAQIRLEQQAHELDILYTEIARLKDGL